MKKSKNIIVMIIPIFIIIYLIIVFWCKINIFCLFHKLTGLYCPGCGITRMFISILQLDFYQAYRYNNLVFILLPFMIIFYIRYLTGKSKLLVNKKVIIAVVIVCIIYGVLRNISYFEYLKPTVLG